LRLNIDSSVQITSGAFTPIERSHSFGFIQISLPSIILLVLGAGAAIRFAMLALGFWRLRRYRRDSSVVPGAFQDLQRRIGVNADVHVSSDTSGPVTFGFLRPVILLPETCLQDESIVCHELLHVHRRDWLFTVMEECVLSLFWFHPAMWWLVAQIQLAREEAVDREAVAILNSRERYLESLLALATARVGLDLVPASPFLRRRHLQITIELVAGDIRRHASLSGLAGRSILSAAGGAAGKIGSTGSFCGPERVDAAASSARRISTRSEREGD
jgi:beta-lactamase regulating signal transducer with metallopeptidase domain